MRVLVTGAAGFLGSAVSVALRRRPGIEVFATARRANTGNLVADLSNPPAAKCLLDIVCPDVVVNCAARADFSHGVLPDLIATNSIAPGLIAAWCRAAGTHLVHCSATLIHGMGASMIDAQTPIRPDTDYGKSKVLAEELISASGCKAAMVRLGGIFGRRGPDHLGLNRAIRAAAEGRPPTVVGTGRALRNYIHVDDAAEALAQAAVSGLTGTHLLAGSQVLSIADMLQAVCDAYLPGTTPVRADGPEAADQVVEVSGALRPSRPFAEALRSEA